MRVGNGTGLTEKEKGKIKKKKKKEGKKKKRNKQDITFIGIHREKDGEKGEKIHEPEEKRKKESTHHRG